MQVFSQSFMYQNTITKRANPNITSADTNTTLAYIISDVIKNYFANLTSVPLSSFALIARARP